MFVEPAVADFIKTILYILGSDLWAALKCLKVCKVILFPQILTTSMHIRLQKTLIVIYT
jgi:hypothetical protein